MCPQMSLVAITITIEPTQGKSDLLRCRRDEPRLVCLTESGMTVRIHVCRDVFGLQHRLPKSANFCKDNYGLFGC